MEQVQNSNLSQQDGSGTSFTVEKAGYIALALVTFLLPIFFIPSRFYLLEASKVILLSAGVVSSLLLFLLSVVKRGQIEFPKHKMFLGVILVPVVFLISALLGSDPTASLFGYILEQGTWAFITVGFALLFLVTFFLNSRRRALYSYLGFLFGVIVVLLIAISKIVFGPDALSFGVLNGVIGNPIGSWMDLAVFLGVSTVITVMAIEMVPLGKLHKSILFFILIFSLFVLAVLNFQTVWLLLLIFSLVFFVYFVSSWFVDNSQVSGERRVSYYGLFLFIVSLLFFFNPNISDGGRLGDVLSQNFGVSNVEVRPSFSATREIVAKTLSSNLLLGSGPNTFDTQWLMNKPEGVNASEFWNTPFMFGFSLLLTFIVTTGILGVLAWLIFFVFYLKLGVQSMFLSISDKLSRFLLVASFMASLFLWIMATIYVPGVTVFALAFFFTGLFSALAMNAGLISMRTITFGHNAKLSFMAILLLIALLVGTVIFAYNAIVRLVSLGYFQKALIAANESGDINLAISHLEKAAGLAGYDVYYRSLSQAYVVKVNQSLGDLDLTEEERVTIFQNSLRGAITSAQNAINANNRYYLNWLSLGNIYESLVSEPLALEGAYESAKSAYREALTKNPNSPEIYLMLARLEVLNGNIEEARGFIDQSLAKKDNYTNAYFLLTQIELAENNLDRAIESAQRAALLSPNNAGIFFQLGLLKYNALDYEGAAEALSWATRIVPNYANAKYFLGLSLEKLGRQAEAIVQFEDLALTNPDNEEVSIILENLRRGVDPFSQLPSDISDVSTRPAPPITEGEQP